ncbi:hypothetical protein CRG98_034173, partial [Punica granatum]
ERRRGLSHDEDATLLEANRGAEREEGEKATALGFEDAGLRILREKSEGLGLKTGVWREREQRGLGVGETLLAVAIPVGADVGGNRERTGLDKTDHVPARAWHVTPSEDNALH